MAITSKTFFDQLCKTRILPAERIDEFRDSPACPEDAGDLHIAQAAVQSGLLTKFQAEEILNGRARRLRVGDYALTDILGFGGMGTVYIGRHVEDGSRGAVKLLGEQFKHDDGMRARFQLEARSGMQFSHPRLVRTLDYGRIEDLFGEIDYMVMELVEGVTLLEGVTFSDGPMKWDAACDVICQSSEGLAYLHEQGMVHRDVKPDNILIDMRGNAKLLDFGLTLADQTALSDEFSLAMIFGHDCLGTADFIPPEQSLDSLQVDHRADIYSLGCTLFVALTAHRPFRARDRGAMVRAHRTEARPRIDKYNRQVPSEVVDLVERMMSIDADERPQSVNEVIEALEPFRRRRNWSFEFNQVLAQRRQLKRKILSKSKMQEESGRPTRLNARAETDPPGDDRQISDENG
jgi:eukaryotic-like serine/threonine-protein kinase